MCMYVYCLRAHKVYDWSTFLHYFVLVVGFFFVLFFCESNAQELMQYLRKVNYNRETEKLQEKPTTAKVLLKMKPYFGPSYFIFVFFFCTLTRANNYVRLSHTFHLFFFTVNRNKEVFCCYCCCWTIKTGRKKILKCRFRAIFVYAWIIQLCIKLYTVVFAWKYLKTLKKSLLFCVRVTFFFLSSQHRCCQVGVVVIVVSSSSLTLETGIVKVQIKLFKMNKQTNRRIGDSTEYNNGRKREREKAKKPNFFKQINRAVKKTIM